MIEDALLKYLGIYPEIIERFDAVCEKVCAEHGIDSDEEVWPEVKWKFDEMCGLGSNHQLNMTNAIIRMAFGEVAGALVEHGVDDGRIDWHVDGMCSDFYIDGEEQ